MPEGVKGVKTLKRLNSPSGGPIRTLEPRTQSLEPRTQNLEPGTQKLEPRTYQNLLYYY